MDLVEVCKSGKLERVKDEALRFSVENGHVEVVRLLLDRGANIHAIEDEALRFMPNSSSCINLVRIYIHDDSLFVNQCRVFGVLRRHVHSLEELCRKAILVYTRCIPDKIEEIDFELSAKILKSIGQSLFFK